MTFKSNDKVASGTLDAIEAGSFASGPAMPMARVKIGSLSAQITVDAETSSLTVKAVWQGSNAEDFASPVDLKLNELATLDASAIVLDTGTGGADASNTMAVPAPDAAYGFRWVRCRLLVGGATGTTADTYSMGYNYRI